MTRRNTTDEDGGLRSLTFREEEPERASGAFGEGSSGRGKNRTRKVLVILLGLLLILSGTLGLGVFVVSEQLGGQVERIPDAFGGLDEDTRPDRPSEGAGSNSLNILLTGLDTRSDAGTTGADAGDSWQEAGQRTDTMIILHIADDRESANLISLPRDSWVSIPGQGNHKLNAAYSLGGPSLYIETVEEITNLRVDHLAVIDWDGFRDLTDALGGVEMTFDEPVEGASREIFEAGEHTLDGEEALDYVRARYNLPDGDFDRVRRQQNFLRSLMNQTLSSGTITNPVRLRNVLDAITQNLSVDEEFSTGKMRDLAVELRNIRGNDVTFMTAPSSGTGQEGDEDVVYLDDDKLNELFEAVRVDDIDNYLDEHGDEDELGDDVR